MGWQMKSDHELLTVNLWVTRNGIHVFSLFLLFLLCLKETHVWLFHFLSKLRKKKMLGFFIFSLN